MDAEIKLGAYLCQGCGLGERLDAERLAKVAEEGGAELVRRHEFLCSDAGVAQIHDDIADGVTHVVIAPFSRRAKNKAVSFYRG
ncbi:MAG: heterodisulfide reductase, partial [bacterium]